MFIFIMPLRSPKTCKNWEIISSLCNQTLRSIYQQTSPNFKIILICNEPPVNINFDQRFILVQDDFPIPRSLNEGYGDIFKKMKRGMVEARRFYPKFVMKVDADDLVSKHLVTFAETHSQSDGWYFPFGYIHIIGKNYLFLRPRFTALCGSSNIFRCDKDDFPDSMDTPPSDWLEPVCQHQNTKKLLKAKSRQLKPLPFPGAVYRLNTGENMQATPQYFSSFKSSIWKLICYRRLTRNIKDEFAFPNEEVH